MKFKQADCAFRQSEERCAFRDKRTCTLCLRYMARIDGLTVSDHVRLIDSMRGRWVSLLISLAALLISALTFAAKARGE